MRRRRRLLRIVVWGSPRVSEGVKLGGTDDGCSRAVRCIYVMYATSDGKIICVWGCGVGEKKRNRHENKNDGGKGDGL